MRLFIEPNDILMFRDGRPFSGGDDHFARGTFPPSPATVYGALRSHILSTVWPEFNKFASDHGSIPEHIRKEIGTPETGGSLTIRQFTIAEIDGKGIQLYFPMPKDVVKKKGDDKSRLYMLRPEKMLKDKILSNLPSGLWHLWHPDESVFESVAGFLSETAMSEYLRGETPDKWTEPIELYQPEERTGIRKSRTSRSVKTGGLYSVEYFRLNRGVGFSLEIEGTTLLQESGILRLGGDNRAAYYTKTAWNDIPVAPIKERISETGKFKVVLTSPALFEGGWLPAGIDGETMQGTLKGIRVKMTGACLGKSIGFGGFDLVKKMPKVMKRGIPAGSVYYFELKENNADELFDRMWLQSISDEKAQEGFGTSLIGGY